MDLDSEIILFTTPEDRQEITEKFGGLVLPAEAYDLELPFATAKGLARWVRTTERPLWKLELLLLCMAPSKISVKSIPS